MQRQCAILHRHLSNAANNYTECVHEGARILTDYCNQLLKQRSNLASALFEFEKLVIDNVLTDTDTESIKRQAELLDVLKKILLKMVLKKSAFDSTQRY